MANFRHPECTCAPPSPWHRSAPSLGLRDTHEGPGRTITRRCTFWIARAIHSYGSHITCLKILRIRRFFFDLVFPAASSSVRKRRKDENFITYEARGTTTNHSGSWLSSKPSSHAWNDVHACTGNLVIALGIIDDSRLVSRRLSVRSDHE